MASLSLQPESADPLAEHPNFVTRFPWQFHDDVEEIKANVQAWMVDRWPFPSEKHAEQYRAMVIEDWSTLMVYGAPKDRAELYALMMSMITIYDDMVECMFARESERMVTRLCAYVSGGNEPEDLNMIEQIVVDVVRMTKGAPSSVVGIGKMTERYMEAFCMYLRASASKKERKAVLDQGAEAYLEYRAGDVGALFGLIGQLWAREIVVPDHEHIFSDQDMIDLQNTFCFQQGTVNDMYSYRKERKLQDELRGADSSTPQPADGFIWCNLLCVFMQSNQMNPAEAVAEVKRLTRHLEDQFAEMLEKLRIKYADSAEDLGGVNGLGQAMMDFMGGTTHWYDYSNRYNKGFSPKP